MFLGNQGYIRDDRGRFAELVARVNPHLLTVQLSIDRSKTFQTMKVALRRSMDLADYPGIPYGIRLQYA